MSVEEPPVPHNDNDCFLSEEERQLLRDMIKLANLVKGSVIKGFGLGFLLFLALGLAGLAYSFKEIKQFFWG